MVKNKSCKHCGWELIFFKAADFCSEECALSGVSIKEKSKDTGSRIPIS
ncbi:hypothetical protein LCM23_13150 [Cytobacillus kochii]|nr:hypothetical protein [Cytobacillus kochii]MCA1027042.1 hypothetical protein [Cytobacillus kochii]